MASGSNPRVMADCVVVPVVVDFGNVPTFACGPLMQRDSTTDCCAVGCAYGVFVVTVAPVDVIGVSPTEQRSCIVFAVGDVCRTHDPLLPSVTATAVTGVPT